MAVGLRNTFYVLKLILTQHKNLEKYLNGRNF